MKHYTLFEDNCIKERMHLFITDTQVSIMRTYECGRYGTWAYHATFKRGPLGIQFTVDPKYPDVVFNTFEDHSKREALSIDLAVKAVKFLKEVGEYNA